MTIRVEGEMFPRIATLPGEEDMDGLQELLDPRTLEGRAARIALLTKGTYPLSLATEGMLEKPTHKVVDHPPTVNVVKTAA